MSSTMRLTAVLGAMVLATASVFTTGAQAAVPRWSDDHLIARVAPSSVGGGHPVVHTSATGADVVTWFATGGEPSVAVKDAGGAWSAPKALTPGKARAPFVWSGIGGRGRAVVVYRVDSGKSYWLQRQPGGQWSAVKQLPSSVVAFDMAQSGLAEVLSYGADRALYSQVLGTDGNLRAPVRLTPPHPKFGYLAPSAVIADDGEVTATWVTVTTNTESEVSGDLQRGGTTAGGRAAPAVTVATRNSVGASLTKSASGDSVALEYESPAGDAPTWTTLFHLADGAWHSWSVPADTKPDYNVVPVLDDRRLSVFWAGRPTTSATTIYVEDYTGGTWAGPAVVHSAPSAAGRGLLAAMSPSERLVAWTNGFHSAQNEPFSTTLRDRRSGALTEYGFGPRSTVGSLSAVGGHAAFAWLGGPSGLGLRVRTR